METTLVLGYDVGTTATKTALVAFRHGQAEFVAIAEQSYDVIRPADGWVEQDPEIWWTAIKDGTHQCLQAAGIKGTEVKGLAFSAQMQGFVPVQADGKALGPALSYLDSRAQTIKETYFRHQFPRYQGMPLPWLSQSLRITKGAPVSAKDPIWKYLWFQNTHPQAYRRLAKWLDIKDYLVSRCTQDFTATLDTAHLTWLFDVRPGKEGWSLPLLKRYQIPPEHLPRVIASSELAGTLSHDAAIELALPVGLPVYGGLGDVSATAIGTASRAPFSMHTYWGTSGWTAIACTRPIVDLSHFLAAILGEERGKYYYIGEQETVGASLDWAHKTWMGSLSDQSFYQQVSHQLLHELPQKTDALFAPWLHGLRAPQSNEMVRGTFLGLGLSTTPKDLTRAVAEGLALHQKWIVDAMARRLSLPPFMQLAGGLARTPGIAQLLADVLNLEIRVTEHPAHAGVRGAAIMAAEGLGVSFDERTLRFTVFHPRPAFHQHYQHQYQRFVTLYPWVRKTMEKGPSPITMREVDYGISGN